MHTVKDEDFGTFQFDVEGSEFNAVIKVKDFGEVGIFLWPLSSESFADIKQFLLKFVEQSAEVKRLALQAILDTYNSSRLRMLEDFPEDAEEISRQFPADADTLKIDREMLSTPHLYIGQKAFLDERYFVLAYSATYEEEHGVAVAFSNWRTVACDWIPHVV